MANKQGNSMSNENIPTNRHILLSRKNIVIIIIIFVSGIIASSGFNSILAYTNEMEFCTSCHSMKINLEEYKETVHYKNASGVQATCSDCHVPKEFIPKMKAKILAYKDVLHEVLGTIDTKEKYEAHRWEMASRVWEKMQATDSRECRSCHDFDNMAFSEQDRSARKKHPRAQLKGQTCIDCHKGIAHEEPDEPDEPEIEVSNNDV
jgi:cytochrome c-type protein NapC